MSFFARSPVRKLSTRYVYELVQKSLAEVVSSAECRAEIVSRDHWLVSASRLG
jgi:hypothetical protein